MTNKTSLSLSDLTSYGFDRVLEFGQPLAYPLLCTAYTVEKLTLWHKTTEEKFETIAIKAPHMPKARIEGNLYRMSFDQVKQLDIIRQVGVQYERKRVPVYVPFLDEYGNPARIYAYIYVGLKQNWVPQIEYENGILRRNSTFSLADKYPDSTKLLHNRYSFAAPLVEAPRTVAGPDVIAYVGRRNQFPTVLPSNFELAERQAQEQAKKQAQREKWAAFRRRMYSFVND